MSLKVSVILGVMLVVLFFLWSVTTFAQDLTEASKDLVIELQSKKMINQVNKNAEIIVYLKNISDTPIEVIEPAIDERSLRIDVVMPDGRKDKLIDIYGLRLQTVRLYPNKRIKFKTTFMPEKIGTYEIKAKYNGYNNEVLTAKPINIYVVGSKIQTK